jgi:hypothetical protein
MEALLTALSPLIVSLLAKWLKPAKARFQLGSEGSLRRLGVRSLVAFLSLGAAFGTSLLTGAEIDIVSIDTFVQTFVTFLGATGIYYLAKAKSTD